MWTECRYWIEYIKGKRVPLQWRHVRNQVFKVNIISGKSCLYNVYLIWCHRSTLHLCRIPPPIPQLSSNYEKTSIPNWGTFCKVLDQYLQKHKGLDKQGKTEKNQILKIKFMVTKRNIAFWMGSWNIKRILVGNFVNLSNYSLVNSIVPILFS